MLEAREVAYGIPRAVSGNTLSSCSYASVKSIPFWSSRIALNHFTILVMYLMSFPGRRIVSFMIRQHPFCRLLHGISTYRISREIYCCNAEIAEKVRALAGADHPWPPAFTLQGTYRHSRGAVSQHECCKCCQMRSNACKSWPSLKQLHRLTLCTSLSLRPYDSIQGGKVQMIFPQRQGNWQS